MAPRVYTDDFSYPDGPLSNQPNWSEHPANVGCTVISNQVGATAGTSQSLFIADQSYDQEVEFTQTVNTLATAANGAVVRQDPNFGSVDQNYQLLWYAQTTSRWRIRRRFNASSVVVVEVAAAGPSIGERFKFSAIGDTITGWRRSNDVDPWVAFITYVDPDPLGPGYVGLYGQVSEWREDNFVARYFDPYGGDYTEVDGVAYITFTRNGTLTVPEPLQADCLIVGGGGAGGSQHGAGGGGGMVNVYGTSLAPDSYPVVVGAGGLPTRDAPGDGANGLPGGSSSFNGQTAEGGGGGGSYQKATVASVGPGGGGGSAPAQAGGVSSLSNNGGAGDNGTQNGGGGGGAGPGAVGGAGNGSDAGDGGNGYLWIDGEYYGGGGGGGGVSEAASGEGGLGGGGQGTYNATGGDGVAGKGGGGGGTRDFSTFNDGGRGGSGVVIVSYLLASNITPPVISGTPEEGATITATPGVWEGNEPITGSWEYSPNNDLTTWLAASQTGLSIHIPYETTGFYARYVETSAGITAISNILGPFTKGPPPKWVPLQDQPFTAPLDPKWVPLEAPTLSPPNPKWVPLMGGFPTLNADSPVSFTGAVSPGVTLTRVPAVWSRADSVVVEWLLDDVVVATNTNTYLVPDQVGSIVAIRETATGSGTTMESEYSDEISKVFTGGEVFDAGGFRYHLFKTSGEIVVQGVFDCEVLVVAGGGGGGGGNGGGNGGEGGGGGGGAGGVQDQSLVIPSGTHPITVGAGGQAGNGQDSSIGSLLSALGGGEGGPNNYSNGSPGGSGGGGSKDYTTGGGNGGAGTAGQGNDGGRAGPSGPGGGSDPAGGGGGGAGAVGNPANGGNAGAGGAGVAPAILAELVAAGVSVPARVAGGGGAAGQGSGNVGQDGGGTGAGRNDEGGTNATAQTGSGGGGSRGNTNAVGGSGIVVIKYPYP